MGTNYPALLLRAERRPIAWPTDSFYPSGFLTTCQSVFKRSGNRFASRKRVKSRNPEPRFDSIEAEKALVLLSQKVADRWIW